MDLDDVRRPLHRLATAFEDAAGELRAGRRLDLGLDDAFAAWDGPGWSESIAALVEARDGADNDDARARYAQEAWFAARAAGTMAARLPLARVRADLLERRIPLAGMPDGATVEAVEALIVATSDRSVREGLAQGALNARAAVLDPLGAAWDRSLEAWEGLGHAGPLALAQALGGLDVAAFVDEARSFLSATDEMFEDLLDWWMRRSCGVSLGRSTAAHHDLFFAMAARPPVGRWPGGLHVRQLTELLGGLGVGTRARRAIHLDLERLPHRVTGGSCTGRQGGATVVVRLVDGPEDGRVVLEQLGRALFFAERSPSVSTWSGDPSMLLAWGHLFDAMPLSSLFWRAFDASDSDLPRVAALATLCRTRLDAVRLLVLDEQGDASLSETTAARGADRVGDALGIRWPKTLYYYDIMDGAGPLHRLRGRALAAQLHRQAVEGFDEDWWRNPRVAPWLASLPEAGQGSPASLSALATWLEAALTGAS